MHADDVPVSVIMTSKPSIINRIAVFLIVVVFISCLMASGLIVLWRIVLCGPSRAVSQSTVRDGHVVRLHGTAVDTAVGVLASRDEHSIVPVYTVFDDLIGRGLLPIVSSSGDQDILGSLANLQLPPASSCRRDRLYLIVPLIEVDSTSSISDSAAGALLNDVVKWSRSICLGLKFAEQEFFLLG